VDNVFREKQSRAVSCPAVIWIMQVWRQLNKTDLFLVLLPHLFPFFRFLSFLFFISLFSSYNFSWDLVSFVLWVVQPCTPIATLGSVIALLMDVASTAETSEIFCHTTRYNNPNYNHLHICCLENLNLTNLSSCYHFVLPPNSPFFLLRLLSFSST
jgi:hypothetical protein